jgi:MFS family permease
VQTQNGEAPGLDPEVLHDLTGSSLQLGVSLALFTAPDALLAPVIGWAVDSRSGRRLLLVAAAGQALAFGGLALVRFDVVDPPTGAVDADVEG